MTTENSSVPAMPITLSVAKSSADQAHLAINGGFAGAQRGGDRHDREEQAKQHHRAALAFALFRRQSAG